MAKLITKLARKGKRAAKKSYKAVETRALAVVGRQAIKKAVKRGGRTLAREVLTAAALAAAGVAVRKVARRALAKGDVAGR